MKKKHRFSLFKFLGAALIVSVLVYGYLSAPKSESYLRQRSVRIYSDAGSCSGEQVRAPSGVDYILSAGHCNVIPKNGIATIEDEAGNVLQRKVIAEDPNSDLLLLEGLPNLKGLDLASSSYASQHVRTFTHGKRLDTYKTEGELIQLSQIDIMTSLLSSKDEEAACTGMPKYKLLQISTPFGTLEACMLHLKEVASTAKIVPGSSGGMVVDDQGDLVGVASATDENFNYFVAIDDIRSFLAGY